MYYLLYCWYYYFKIWVNKNIKMSSFYLINDKVSLKQQLLVSYSFITIISAGITLGICYGLLFSLKDTASTTATNNLISQTNSNAQALATEIANTINQQIATVGESVCMVSAQYASILLANAHNGSRGGTILEHVRDFFPTISHFLFFF